MFVVKSGQILDPNGQPVTSATIGGLTHIVGGRSGTGECVIVTGAVSPIQSLSVLGLVHPGIVSVQLKNGDFLYIIKAMNGAQYCHVIFNPVNGAWTEITNAWQNFAGMQVRRYGDLNEAVTEVTTPGAPVYIPRDKLNL